MKLRSEKSVLHYPATKGATVALWDRHLDDMEYCVCDLETTGMSPDYDAIVEVAMIRMRADGSIVESLDTLVNPRQRVRATEIHGITDADVRHAPTIDDLSSEICRMLHGAVLVTYNVYFDLPFMEAQVLRPSACAGAVPALCAMYMRGLLGLNPSRMKLPEACRSAGVAFQECHQAFADAEATQRLFRCYLTEARAQEIHTFADFRRSGKSYKFMNDWRRDPLSFSAAPTPVKLRPRTPQAFAARS